MILTFSWGVPGTCIMPNLLDNHHAVCHYCTSAYWHDTWTLSSSVKELGASLAKRLIGSSLGSVEFSQIGQNQIHQGKPKWILLKWIGELASGSTFRKLVEQSHCINILNMENSYAAFRVLGFDLFTHRLATLICFSTYITNWFGVGCLYQSLA